MASSQPSKEVTVSVDGITVVKRFEEDEFPVPAIAFEFHSARDEPVTARLRDVVPEEVAVEDLGFHPEYGSEYWTVDDGEISFEREFDPGAEYTTVYGIRATDTKDIDQFMVEPSIEAVDPPLSGSGDTGTAVDVIPGDQEAVKDAISGDGTVPGLERAEESEDGETEADTETERLDLKDPTAEASEGDADQSEAGADGPEQAEGADEEVPVQAGDESVAAAAAAADTRLADSDDEEDATDDEAEPEDGAEAKSVEDEAKSAEDVADEAEPEPAIREADTAGPAGEPVEGSLLATLAEEVREDDAPEEDVELLREALGAAEPVEGTTEARLQQLQQDVADLRAYTDALDEFLDENGTAQQVLEDTRTKIDSFENQLAEFGETVDRVETDADEATTTAQEAKADVETIRSEVEDVHGEVADVQDNVVDVEEEVGDVAADVEGVQGSVDDVQEDVTDIEEDVGEVQTGVDDVRDDIAALQTDLEGASMSIDDLEERTTAFEAELDDLTEEVHDGEIAGRLDEMESTLADLQEWQTQIKETFGGE